MTAAREMKGYEKDPFFRSIIRAESPCHVIIFLSPLFSVIRIFATRLFSSRKGETNISFPSWPLVYARIGSPPTHSYYLLGLLGCMDAPFFLMDTFVSPLPARKLLFFLIRKKGGKKEGKNIFVHFANIAVVSGRSQRFFATADNKLKAAENARYYFILLHVLRRGNFPRVCAWRNILAGSREVVAIC